MLTAVPAIEESALDHIPVALQPCLDKGLGARHEEVGDVAGVIEQELRVVAQLGRNENAAAADVLPGERVGEHRSDDLPSAGVDVARLDPPMTGPARIARCPKARWHPGATAERGLDLVEGRRVGELGQFLDIDAGVVVALVVVGVRVLVQIAEIEGCAIGPDEALVLLFPYGTERLEQPLRSLDRREQRDLGAPEEQTLRVGPVALCVQRPITKARVRLAAASSATIDDLEDRAFDERLLRPALGAPDVLSCGRRAPLPTLLR